MRHLVLGARGQIGRHLVRRLLQGGSQVREIDLVLGDSHDLRQGDNQRLIAGVEWCDIVQFLAFDVGGSPYLERYQNTYAFISNNSRIMNTVFDVLERTGKPFLFTSTQMANMAHSTYGLLKSIGEAYTRSLGGIVVTLWNVYGRETDRQKSHVITDFIRKARDHGKIEMRTSGTEERQFVYADDCADCLIALSQRRGDIRPGAPLHITSFEWTSINSVAVLVSSIFDNCPIVVGTGEDKVQRNLRYEPDPYVLKFWRPKTSLADGVRQVAEKMAAGSELQSGSTDEYQSERSDVHAPPGK